MQRTFARTGTCQLTPAPVRPDQRAPEPARARAAHRPAGGAPARGPPRASRDPIAWKRAMATRQRMGVWAVQRHMQRYPGRACASVTASARTTRAGLPNRACRLAASRTTSSCRGRARLRSGSIPMRSQPGSPLPGRGGLARRPAPGEALRPQLGPPSPPPMRDPLRGAHPTLPHTSPASCSSARATHSPCKRHRPPLSRCAPGSSPAGFKKVNMRTGGPRLDRVGRDEAEHRDRPRLPDAVHAPDRLLLHRRVHAGLQQEHLAGCARAPYPMQRQAVCA